MSSPDGGVVYDGLREKDLETVLPPSSDFHTSKVMILSGPYKNEFATILSKDRKNEQVTVQMTDEAGMEIINIGMDDVCLYIQP